MGCGASVPAKAGTDDAATAPKVEPPTEKMSRDGMQLSLKQCLASPDALAAFLAFAQKDFSAENLVFWLEVKAYHARWANTESKEEHDKDAQWMITEFLQEGSPQQVKCHCGPYTRVKCRCGPYTASARAPASRECACLHRFA